MTGPSLPNFDGEAFARRLAEVLKSATTENEVLASLEAPWQRELLWRCALARRFDRHTLKDVLASDLDSDKDVPSLYAWLAHHPDIDECSIDVLTMRDAARNVRVHSSPTPPLDAAVSARYREMAIRLGAHYGARGREWELDALSVMAVAEPAGAIRQAKRAFKSGYEKADFTECFQLVRVLEGRTPLLTALGNGVAGGARGYLDLVDAIDELRRRYDSVRAFGGDFERTTQVLERGVMREAWEWVLPTPIKGRTKAAAARPDRTWMMNLEARGGSGKTVFLRWLSSRRCLPEGVPYARLDFDFVDPRITAAAPWYLLAQLARVLDSQLPGRPLRGLVERADDVVDIGRFSLGPSEAAAALQQLRSSVAEELSFTFHSEMAAILNDALMPAIVVVLDTLEVALVDPEADLMEFLRVLHVVHDNCPSLKVILSGRFDLEKRLDGFHAQFVEHGHVRTLDLTPMDREASMAYLVGLRRLPDGPVTRAIAKRCKGLPLALSLFADEWQINPRLTVREVNEIPGPELHYLVQRVLRRIPRPIAWLLRYSVVARRLTRTFLAEVIVPELEALRRGTSHHNPKWDPKILADFFDDAKKALGEEVLSADRLWQELERHVSAFSFVSRDESTEGALKLHDEVLQPMRRELARRRVTRRLHRAAMNNATKKAGALTRGRELQWAAEQKEALYHALRLSPVLARRLWERLDSLAARRSAFDARRQLANELLDMTVVVPVTLRVAAAREKTEASVALAEQFGGWHLRHWDEASQALAQWRALLPASKRARDARLTVAQQRIASRTGPASAASVRRLQRILKGRRDIGERLELHVALARCVAGTPAALRHVESALELLKPGGVRWPAPKRTHFQLNATDEFIRQGDYERALKLSNRAVSAWTELSLTERADALSRQAWLLTTCGQVHRIQAVLNRAEELDAAILAEGAELAEEIFFARAYLRRNLARGTLEGGPPGPPPLAVQVPLPALVAIDLQTDAELAFERADASTALDCIRRAREAIPQGDPEMVASLFMLAEATSSDLLGDRRQGRSALLAALATSVDDGSDAWWLTRLGQCLHRERADQALREMRVRGKRFPAVWKQVLRAIGALGVAASLGEPKRTRARRAATSQLIAILKCVRPMAARRRLLYRCLPDVRTVPADVMARDRLANVLDIHKPPAHDAPDAEWTQHLVLMAFCHWGPGEPHVMREAASVARCVGLAGDDPPDAICDESALDRSGSPLVKGIATYALARHLSQRGDSARAIELANTARELLTAESVPASVWSARAQLLYYRLTASSNPNAELLLLAAEETCERLGSELGLKEVQLARSLTLVPDDAPRPAKSFISISMESPAAWSGSTPLARAIAADLKEAGSRRTPERVIHELARDFSGGVRTCREKLPLVEGPPTSLHVVMVTNQPVFSALPWELATSERRGASRQSPSVLLTPGWRHDADPRPGINERWIARAFESLQIPGADLESMARAFQTRQSLAVTGRVDASTLRHVVRSLRGGRNPRVAVVLAPSDYGPTGVVERVYFGQAVDVAVVRGSAGNVLKLLKEQRFDVVHIVSPIVESASFGGIAFDLAAGPYSKAASGGRYLTLSELTGALKRSDSLLRPILIVHNTLEKLPVREVIRQYVLRNIAAMELSRTGTPVATVAVSSTWFGSSDGGLYPVIEAVLGGHPLISVIDALNERTNPDGTPLRPRARVKGASAIARELIRFGTCIYANNPEFVLV